MCPPSHAGPRLRHTTAPILTSQTPPAWIGHPKHPLLLFLPRGSLGIVVRRMPRRHGPQPLLPRPPPPLDHDAHLAPVRAVVRRRRRAAAATTPRERRAERLCPSPPPERQLAEHEERHE
ncbi:hypothetical protein CIB48_g5948 [Xylaria polymorpha]|nr:hypothetical protein CIB48_g5948 [Xylaria polymorpha]